MATVPTRDGFYRDLVPSRGRLPIVRQISSHGHHGIVLKNTGFGLVGRVQDKVESRSGPKRSEYTNGRGEGTRAEHLVKAAAVQPEFEFHDVLGTQKAGANSHQSCIYGSDQPPARPVAAPLA